MRFRYRVVTVVGLLAALVCATPSQAGVGITLDLKRGVGNRTIRACGIRHHYTLYRRGSRIAYDGTLAGAPGTFRVKIKIKKCIRGQFVTRFEQHTGGRAGRYHGSFRPGARGFYFARTYYYHGASVTKSDKEFFRVT
jgi:hypothetical protein